MMQQSTPKNKQTVARQSALKPGFGMDLFHDSDEASDESTDEKQLSVRWFKKYEPARKFGEENGHSFFIKKGLYSFGSLGDADAVIEFVQDQDAEDRLFHEMLPDKCRMFVDIDGVNGDKIAPLLAFYRLMDEVFESIDELPDFVVDDTRLCVSKGPKVSFHWSYPSIVFPSLKAQKVFWAYVVGMARSRHYDDLFFMSCGEKEDTFKCMIDLQPYRSKGTLRMVMCRSSAEKANTLVPSRLKSRKGTFSIKSLKKFELSEYLMTPAADAEPITVNVPAMGKMKQIKFNTGDLEKIILDAVDNVAVDEVEGNIIKLRNDGTRTCIIGGEDNDSDNSYAVVRHDGIYYYCHDEDCTESKMIHKFEAPEEETADIDVFADYMQLVDKNPSEQTWDYWVDKTLVEIADAGNRICLCRAKSYNININEARAMPPMYRWQPRKIPVILQSLHKNIEVDNPNYCEETAKKYENTRTDRIPRKDRGKIRMLKFDRLDKLVSTSLQENKVNTYHDIEFYPHLESQNINMHRSFNLFAGYPVEQIKSTGIKFTDSLWYKHMLNEFMNGDVAEMHHWDVFIADAFQDTCSIKPNSHVFQSEPGTGKTMMGTWFGNLFGSEHLKTYNHIDAFFGQFNGFQANAIMTIFEEIEERGSAWSKFNRLKAELTQENINIEPKGLEKYTVRHLSRYLFFSNNEECLRIENLDRRYTMHKVSSRKIGDKAYFRALAAEVNDPAMIRAAYDYYSTLEYKDEEARTCFETAYKAEQRSKSMPIGLEFLKDWVYNMDRSSAVNKDRISEKALYREFKDWSDGQTRLGVRGFATQMEKILGKSSRRRFSGKSSKVYIATKDTIEKAFGEYLGDPSFKFEEIAHEPDSDEDSEEE